MIPCCRQSGGRFEQVIGLVAVVGIVVALIWIVEFSGRPLSMNDLFWQVRTGEIMLSTGEIPGSDPFSYTVPGIGWNNHEWGFELLAALLYRTAGWGGIRILLALLMGGVAIGLAIAAVRRGGAPHAFLVLALFWVMGWYKMSPVPQGLSMGIFLAVFFLFRGEKLALSPLRWGALSLVMLIWGNLTAECLMFLPFLLLDQAALRLDPRVRALPGFPSLPGHLLRLLLVGVAPLINPPQSSVLDYALAGTWVNREFNVEFAPLWSPAHTIDGFGKGVAIVLVPIVVVWALALLARPTGRAHALRQACPGLLAAALATAFERNLWLLLIPVLLMADSLIPHGAAPRRRILVGAGMVLLGGMLLVRSATAYAWNPASALGRLVSREYRSSHIDWQFVPVMCVDPLERIPSVRRVYALRMWASYVIWRLPDVRVFIDGRNREYPVAIHRMADEIWEGGPRALAYLEASATDAVIAYPGWGDLPGIRNGPWRAAFVGDRCAVYLRQPLR